MRRYRGIRFEQDREFNTRLSEARQRANNAYNDISSGIDNLNMAGIKLKSYKGIKVVQALTLLEQAWKKANEAKQLASKASNFLVQNVSWEDWE